MTGKARGLAVVLGLVLFGSLAVEAVGQDVKYKPGDRVQVDMGPFSGPGTVVKVDDRIGWVEVKMDNPPPSGPPSVPPSMLRPLDGGKKPFADEKPRTWSDASAKFAVMATLTGVSDGKVVLKRADGRVVSLALDKLSEKDQAYVGLVMVKAASGSDGVDVPDPTDGMADVGTPEAEPEPEALSMTPTDTSGTREVSLSGAPKSQGIPIDAPSGPPSLVPRRIALQSSANFFEKAEGCNLSPAAGAGVFYFLTSGPGDEPVARFELCDLNRGRSVKSIPAPTELTQLDLSLDGKFLVTRANIWGFGKSSRLDVWRLDGGELDHQISWEPYNDEPGTPNRDIESGLWIAPRFVVTISHSAKMAVWDAPAARQLYWLPLTRGIVPGFSPNRKYMVAATTNGIGVIEIATGKAVTLLTDESLGNGTLRFSPDGSRVAFFHEGRVLVWDLTTGKEYRHFGLPGESSTRDFVWIDSEYLLVNGRFLVNLELRTILWEIDSQAESAVEGGCVEGQYWGLILGRGGGPNVLHGVKLPTDPIRQAASSLNAEEVLALEPGAKLALKFEIQGGSVNQAELRTSLETRLAEHDMALDTNAPIQLILRTRQGESKEVNYTDRRRPFSEGQKYTYREGIAEIEIAANGKTIWKRISISGAPHSLGLEEGQTIAQAIAEHTKPNTNLFKHIWLPIRLVQPEAAFLGKSKP